MEFSYSAAGMPSFLSPWLVVAVEIVGFWSTSHLSQIGLLFFRKWTKNPPQQISENSFLLSWDIQELIQAYCKRTKGFGWPPSPQHSLQYIYSCSSAVKGSGKFWFQWKRHLWLRPVLVLPASIIPLLAMLPPLLHLSQSPPSLSWGLSNVHLAVIPSQMQTFSCISIENTFTSVQLKNVVYCSWSVTQFCDWCTNRFPSAFHLGRTS